MKAKPKQPCCAGWEKIRKARLPLSCGRFDRRPQRKMDTSSRHTVEPSGGSCSKHTVRVAAASTRRKCAWILCNGRHMLRYPDYSICAIFERGAFVLRSTASEPGSRGGVIKPKQRRLLIDVPPSYTTAVRLPAAKSRDERRSAISVATSSTKSPRSGSREQPHTRDDVTTSSPIVLA